MKPKTLMFMGAAIVCGLVAAYMTNRLIADRQVKIVVLVAKNQLNQWQPIRNPQAEFEKKEILQTEAPKNYIVNFEDLKDRVVVRRIQKDKIVQLEDLLDKNKTSMETAIPEGMRPYTLKTDAVASGSFILPGSRVDILHSARVGADAGKPKFVEENLLVRAVGIAQVRPEDKNTLPLDTVTLQVTPAQLLKLTKLEDMGRFKVVLRPFGDEKKIDLAKEDPAPPPPPPPPPPPDVVKDPTNPTAPNLRSVKLLVWNGTKVTTYMHLFDKDDKCVETRNLGTQDLAGPVAKPTPQPPPDREVAPAPNPEEPPAAPENPNGL